MSDKFVTFNEDRLTPTGLPQTVDTKLASRYATKSELHSAIMGTGGVVGIGIHRLIASLDHQTPINDGDLLLKLVPPITEFFTDFSEYELDQPPHDWTPRWKTNNYNRVVADERGTNGVLLREDGVPVSDENRALSWDRLGLRTDVEVVVKFLSSAEPGFPRPAVRGSGDDLPTAYHGGAQVPTMSSISKAVASTSSDSLNSNDQSFSPGEWYITRFRVVGLSLFLKTWPANSPEPNEWDLTAEDRSSTAITEAGWVGIRNFRTQGHRLYDWVGVAVDGGTAPMQAVTS